MEEFNWTQLIPTVTHDTIHVATAACAALAMLILAVVARWALGSGDSAVAPASRLSVKGVFELITEMIVGLCDLVIGDGGRKYAPMFAAIFFYILFQNSMELVPGMTPASKDMNMTIAVGLFSFVLYNYYGFKENGLSYVKHFMGPVLWLAPLMLAIELVSNMIRPLTLGLRLMGNMLADDTIIAVFVHLFKPAWFIPVPAIFYAMGIFVCVVQAFVFTMLSMIYISMATAHDH